MLIAVMVVLALVIAATFFTLRASILEESTNPNHRTLADRACAGQYGWRELIRMRVEAAVYLTLPCRLDALRTLLTVHPKATAEWYADMAAGLNAHKDYEASKFKAAMDASQAA
jgi:hypothetical protein